MYKRSVLSLLFVAVLHSASALSDWADIKRQEPSVQLQTIEAATHSFAVYNISSLALKARGTIIILPDQQQHALSPKGLNALRTHLPKAGWDLVVLPAPLNTDSNSIDINNNWQKTQLAARWELLNQQMSLEQPIVVVSQGEMAAFFNQLLHEELAKRPAAVINLGAFIADYEQHQLWFPTMALLALPQLDIITAEDHPHAINSATQRQLIARMQQNSFYRQRFLAEFYHNTPTQQWLNKEIIGWLKTIGF